MQLPPRSATQAARRSRRRPDEPPAEPAPVAALKSTAPGNLHHRDRPLRAGRSGWTGRGRRGCIAFDVETDGTRRDERAPAGVVPVRGGRQGLLRAHARRGGDAASPRRTPVKQRFARLLEDPQLRLVGAEREVRLQGDAPLGGAACRRALRHDGGRVDAGKRRGQPTAWTGWRRSGSASAPRRTRSWWARARPSSSSPSSRSPTTRRRDADLTLRLYHLLAPELEQEGLAADLPRRGDAPPRGPRGDGACRHPHPLLPSSPRTAGRWRRALAGLEDGDLRAVRQEVQHQLHEAAPGDPLHLAQAHARSGRRRRVSPPTWTCWRSLPRRTRCPRRSSRTASSPS